MCDTEMATTEATNVRVVKMMTPPRQVEVVQVTRDNVVEVQRWVESHDGKFGAGNYGIEISFKDYSSGDAVHRMEWVDYGNFVSVNDHGQFLNIGDASGYTPA